jgi:hypothetical protein
MIYHIMSLNCIYLKFQDDPTKIDSYMRLFIHAHLKDLLSVE